MQRLCDDVGKLKIEFVFWHAAGAVGAGRSSRVAHINEHSKCRSGAIAALAAVLRYRVLSARKLPRGASKHHSQCDKSEKATLIDDHRSQLYRCCGFAAQPRLSGISPRTLYLFACRRTNNMIRLRPEADQRDVMSGRLGDGVILPACLVVRSWRL